MDMVSTGLFLGTAVALLGSPGPAIAALLAVGRIEGLKQGLKYYGGLQVGLGLAAALSGAGVMSFLELFPSALYLMTIIATVYLLYLAYAIGTSPVGVERSNNAVLSSPLSGLFLGLSNPKAYVAFVSLYASYVLVPGNASGDLWAKWALCVAVMIVVDIIWLLVGVGLKQTRMSASKERLFNVSLGGMIVVAMGLTLM
ncbi:MAG: threonine transporter [Rhodospirillaceae bacterium]|nr:MAG: threonine transporter [Rhodospirillaceae bacterium]